MIFHDFHNNTAGHKETEMHVSQLLSTHLVRIHCTVLVITFTLIGTTAFIHIHRNLATHANLHIILVYTVYTVISRHGLLSMTAHVIIYIVF